MVKKSSTTLTATMSAVLLASVVAPAVQAGSDPFVTTEFSSGYNLASNDSDKSKHEEGSCGGKHGEGSCGNMSDADNGKGTPKDKSAPLPQGKLGPDGEPLPQ